ncbi:MAG: hypothetical protein A2Y77_12775 [Planctomycetes bacterium RBG_13_62_9]|nr:MAG: hypothetical protein A2Y77_12775 [Planctomycetes bacterium RBG_13_62_9]
MAARYFNWKLAIVLVVAIAVFAVAAYALHSWQKDTRAGQAKDLGLRAHARQDYETAARELGQYIGANPEDPDILLKYADAQLNRRPATKNTVQQAIGAYRVVLRLAKERPRELSAHYAEAARHLMEIYLAPSANSAPGEAELIGRRYLQQTDKMPEVQAGNKANDVVIRRLLADALWQQRKSLEAAKELTTLIEKYPDDVLGYERLGGLAELRPADANRPAAFWFDEAIAKNPRSALAWTARAGFHLRQSAVEKVRGAMEEARGATDEARAAVEKARAYTEKARADLDRAETLGPSDTDTMLRLIGVSRILGDVERARKHLNALQAKDPTERRLWLYWAELALRSGSVDEMIRVADTGLKSLAAQPWDFMPYATELLISAARLERANGRLERTNGRLERANSCLERANGYLKRANECIAQMRLKDISAPGTAFLEGLVADEQGQLREAVAAWRKALGLGFSEPRIHLLLASAQARLGDIQSAIGELRIVDSLDLRDPNGQPAPDGPLALARLLAQTGDWRGVWDQTQRILQTRPNHSEAKLLELQARTYLLAAGKPARPTEAWSLLEGDIRNAEERLAQLARDPNKAPPVRALRVQAALFQGRSAEAASLLNDLEGQYPSDDGPALLHAELCDREGRVGEAGTRLKDAVAKFPESVSAVRSLAVFLERQGQRQECESVVQAGIARVEETHGGRDLRLLLADFYYRWQEEEKLYTWLTDLTAKFPSDIQVRRLLLTCNKVMQDGPRAQKIIDEIQSLEGERGWQWRYEQARLWNHLGRPGGSDEFKTRYTQAVKLLQENLLINSRDRSSRLLLADTYEKAGESQLAVTTYREALAQSPDNVPILVRAIRALNKMKEFNEAGGLLDRAMQLDPNHLDLQRLQLEANVRQKDWPEASRILEQLADKDANDTSVVLWMAQIRMLEGKLDEAQKILDDLKARTPDSNSVTGLQIDLHLRRGDPNEAIRLCDEMVARGRTAPAYIVRASTYGILGQNERALEDYGRAIAVEPKSANIWAVRADFYRTLGRINEAISDVRQAMALSPDSPTIQRLAALLFIASGDLSLLGEAEAMLDKAVAALDKTLATNKTDALSMEYSQLKLLKARVSVLKRTGPGIEEARRILHELTRSQPKFPEAWELMARIELEQGEPGKALDIALRGLAHNEDNRQLLLLKALAEKDRSPSLAALTLKGLLDSNPKDLEVLINLADAYVGAGRSQQAVELLRQKLPEFTGRERRRCEIAYASALYSNGQREDAKVLFDSLMQAEGNDPTPTMVLAQLLRRERRWTEMNQLVRSWLKMHPKDADVARVIAGTLATTGDIEALQVAEDILRTTLAGNPRSISSLMLLSMMMLDAGRNEESAKLNRKIIELDPNSVEAINNLAWILCEKEKAEEQSYQEALALAEKGLKTVPDYMDLLDTRGFAYYRLGDFEKAASDFARCIELYPTNSPLSATPRFHLAMTYAAMKHKTRAVERLREALDLNRRNIQLAKESSNAGRKTYAIKLLKDALRLQEQMEPLKTALDLQWPNSGPSAEEIADARLLLDQLRKGG